MNLSRKINFKNDKIVLFGLGLICGCFLTLLVTHRYQNNVIRDEKAAYSVRFDRWTGTTTTIRLDPYSDVLHY